MNKDHCVFQNQVTIGALVVLLLMGLLNPSQANPNQAFLKVNQYYVLFTNPVIPFVDKRGNFLVGLQGFSELIGAQSVSAKASMTVRLGNDRVTFGRDSKTVYINGKAVRMAEAPQERRTLQSASLLLQGLSRAHLVGPTTQMLVPVSILAQAFHLQPSWHPKTRTLLLQRRDLVLPVDHSMEVENSKRFEVPALASDHFVPVSLALRSGSLPAYNILRSVARSKGMKLLELTVKNTSSEDFAGGQAYVNIFSFGGPSHGAPMPSVDIPNPPTLALKANSGRSDVTEINGPSSPFVRYVVGWLVIRDLTQN